MTQGAVKTTGKRSRAVSAKKKAILSAALDTFSQFGFHGTRLEQIAELAGVWGSVQFWAELVQPGRTGKPCVARGVVI